MTGVCSGAQAWHARRAQELQQCKAVKQIAERSRGSALVSAEWRSSRQAQPPPPTVGACRSMCDHHHWQLARWASPNFSFTASSNFIALRNFLCWKKKKNADILLLVTSWLWKRGLNIEESERKWRKNWGWRQGTVANLAIRWVGWDMFLPYSLSSSLWVNLMMI